MATCTYSFQTAQGPITIKGQAEFKAYLASQGVESILPATLASNRRAPIFYSPLARAVQEAKMDSMPGKQWGAWLLSNAAKLGVKKDEIEWSGITDWLSLQDGKVSKADIRAYLDGNGVLVEETEKGGHDLLRDVDQAQAYLAYKHGLSRADVRELYGFADPRDYLAVANEMRAADPESKSSTKYSQYTVPGGENYKELLLTLPTEAAKLQKEGDRISRLQNPTPEEIDIFRRANEQGKKASAVYRSSHWKEANILAHVRFDERTDADGKRVLFLIEIQSDFGQDFKKARDAINTAVDSDFSGIVERMKKAGVLEVVCD